ncbi:MAG: hypothetical protein EBR82_50275 [Caulobacteraceae bacterium]|nr:hypothetical protein [Caulobacteraceae bacterium]
MNTIDPAAYEGDIVSRLRHWRGLHLAHSGRLYDEAANEIERLRNAIIRFADQDATLSVQGGSVTVTLDATLTDEEREAVEAAAMGLDGKHSLDYMKRARQASALRSLLERMA